MEKFFSSMERGRRKLLIAMLLVLMASVLWATIAHSAEGPGLPAGCYWKVISVGQEGFLSFVVCPVEDDDSCDYGRSPEALWPDNPDGHPFERAFCDGLTEDQYKHPLDSLENEGLYCDEVPGCWAYGMTQEGHH